MIPVLLSTRNQHKIREVGQILGSRFHVHDLSSLPGLPAVDETGGTFEENAGLKALAASEHFDGWVIADDSGLEVDALQGEPGVHSARYAGPAANDALNNELLLKNLLGTPPENRSARFRCVIVIARAGRIMAAFDGFVEGRILTAPRGRGGFGYDPLFVPSGHDASFAELPPTIKNSISHRSRALDKMADWGGFF